MNWTMTIPVLSSAHITANTHAWLQDNAGDWSSMDFAVYSHGFFISLGEIGADPTEKFPEHPDLQAIMRWVHQNHPDATWVRLDGDGDVINELPKYKW